MLRKLDEKIDEYDDCDHDTVQSSIGSDPGSRHTDILAMLRELDDKIDECRQCRHCGHDPDNHRS